LIVDDIVTFVVLLLTLVCCWWLFVVFVDLTVYLFLHLHGDVVLLIFFIFVDLHDVDNIVVLIHWLWYCYSDYCCCYVVVICSWLIFVGIVLQLLLHCCWRIDDIHWHCYCCYSFVIILIWCWPFVVDITLCYLFLFNLVVLLCILFDIWHLHSIVIWYLFDLLFIVILIHCVYSDDTICFHCCIHSVDHSDCYCYYVLVICLFVVRYIVTIDDVLLFY